MYTLIVKELNFESDVNSIAEVREIVYDLADTFDLGASTWDWDGSKLLKENKVIGRVSFNGRVWDENENEILD